MAAELRARKIKRYGWIPDLPDTRDFLYAAPLQQMPTLPPSVDLQAQCPSIYDQGQLGSCTGNAIAGAIQFDRIKQNLNQAPALVPSRLFIYFNERVIEGTVEQDSGAQIRDGIKSTATLGVCFESDVNAWPYDIQNFAQRPPDACFEAALQNKVVQYSRVTQSLTQFKGCLASGFPFVFGFSVYEGFESEEVAKSGDLNMPAHDEKLLGGHAVLAVGYDDARQHFKVRNSWGSQWGQEGYFTIPYAYLTDRSLASDFWTVRIVQGASAAVA